MQRWRKALRLMAFVAASLAPGCLAALTRPAGMDGTGAFERLHAGDGTMTAVGGEPCGAGKNSTVVVESTAIRLGTWLLERHRDPAGARARR